MLADAERAIVDAVRRLDLPVDVVSRHRARAVREQSRSTDGVFGGELDGEPVGCGHFFENDLMKLVTERS